MDDQQLDGPPRANDASTGGSINDRDAGAAGQRGGGLVVREPHPPEIASAILTSST
jgi:hypothetical protein